MCDFVCLLVMVLLGDKTMDHLYGNGKKIASFSLVGHALVIELLQYQVLPLIDTLCDYCFYILYLYTMCHYFHIIFFFLMGSHQILN